MTQSDYKKKVGIMGGSFNPIHNGHLAIAEAAYHEFGLDKVMFLPNGNPPHKQHHKQMVDVTDRIEMVRLATAGVPYFEVNTYEAEKEGPCYSAETLKEFSEIYQDTELYFLMGADSLRDFETWYHPEQIAKYAILCVAQRDDMDEAWLRKRIQELTEDLQADIRVVHMNGIVVSSSDIRTHLNSASDITDLIPLSVYRYMKEHHLYEAKTS